MRTHARERRASIKAPAGRLPCRALVGGPGFTVVELLVASSLAVLVLIGVYSLLDSSRKTYGAGRARVEIQQSARMAMDLMGENLRRAGYGFPTDTASINPQLKITAATPTSITFWADLTNASTTLASDVNPGATSLTVANAAGIKAGDTIRLINGATWQALTVSSVNGATVTVPGPGVTVFYPRGIQVGRPKPVTFSWNAGTISRDDGEGGGLQPLADGIQAFQLRYFDGSDAEITPPNLAANLASIRRLSLSVTAQSAAGTANPQSLTITSDVRPRNLF